MSVDRACDIKMNQMTSTCASHAVCMCFLCALSFYMCTTQQYWLPKWACHHLYKWCTARVPLFWFTSLWRWFQDCTLMILWVKQLLKARCLHCCHWTNQTGERRTIGTMCFKYSPWWMRITQVPSDESLLDCWSGLNKALINMIVVVCFWRGTQEHVFSMIAAHLPRMRSKGTLTWLRTTAQMPCNQRISVNSTSEGKASLIDNNGRYVNANFQTSCAVIT